MRATEHLCYPFENQENPDIGIVLPYAYSNKIPNPGFGSSVSNCPTITRLSTLFREITKSRLFGEPVIINNSPCEEAALVWVACKRCGSISKYSFETSAVLMCILILICYSFSYTRCKMKKHSVINIEKYINCCLIRRPGLYRSGWTS